MAGLLEIWNLALGRIGEGQAVTSENENSETADVCRRFYDIARRSVIHDFDWNFARRTVALTPISGLVLPPFSYFYATPPGSIAIRGVFVSDPVAERLALAQFGAGSSYPLEWEVHGVTGDDESDIEVIACRQEAAYAVYSRDVTDTGRFPPLFVDALGWRLAMDAALLRARQDQLRQTAWQAYMQVIERAAVQSERERARREVEPDLIAARA